VRKVPNKAKVVFMQLSSCWGCHQSLLDLNEKLLDVLPLLDIQYWVAAVDFKLEHLEKLPKGGIDVAFVEGLCRTQEDVHLLKLCREKAKTVVALGTCSTYGGIPSLANLYPRKDLIERKYVKSETVPEKDTIPSENVPQINKFIPRNDQLVKVDVYLPGCPPTSEQIANATLSLLNGKPLEHSIKSVCDECERKKEEKNIKEFHRDFEGKPDPEKCLLNQGYLCMGPGTRAGCGAQCPTANNPCQGCGGPPEGVIDQGTRLIGTYGGIADMDLQKMLNSFKDPAGQLYKFTYASSTLSKIRSVKKDEK
jgi:F420-non-reducing hydrogenase small subunit